MWVAGMKSRPSLRHQKICLEWLGNIIINLHNAWSQERAYLTKYSYSYLQITL